MISVRQGDLQEELLRNQLAHSFWRRRLVRWRLKNHLVSPGRPPRRIVKESIIGNRFCGVGNQLLGEFLLSTGNRFWGGGGAPFINHNSPLFVWDHWRWRLFVWDHEGEDHLSEINYLYAANEEKTVCKLILDDIFSETWTMLEKVGTEATLWGQHFGLQNWTTRFSVGALRRQT